MKKEYKEDRRMASIKTKKLSNFLRESRILDISLLVILTAIAHRGWFRPGMLDFGDLWDIPKEVLVKFFTFPYIWISQSPLGGYCPDLYVYPYWWFAGLIARLGFDYSVSQRMIYFFPYLFFSIFSMYYFAYVLFNKRAICFFATLFFVFNTFILQVIAGGIVILAIAYALCPLILALFIKGLQQKQLKYGILAGVFLSLSIAYHPPTAYLTIGAILLFFTNALIRQIIGYTSFRYVKRKGVSKLVSYLILVLIIPIVLHFYWILPSLLVKAPKIGLGHESVGWVYALSYAKLSHAVSIYNICWPPGSTGIQPVRIQYFIIPLLVLVGIVSCFKDKNVRLLAIIALISVFFAKGTNKPFGEVYAWFFKYFPGGSMFRTPGKFHCLTNLAYAPLLGVGIDFLANLFRKIEFKKLKMPFKKNILKPIFLFFMFCFMIYLVFPAFQGKLGGTFDAHRIPEEYEKIKKFIKSQLPHFRTFWRPHTGRYAFYSQEYPLFNAYQYTSFASEGSRYFLWESVNPYAFTHTNYIAKILGILNVKYCFLPLEKEYLHLLGKDRDFYISTFNNQEGLEKIDTGENIDVFVNKYFAPRFFLATHGALVVGGRKALFLLASLEGMDFSRWNIFFADELKDDSRDLLSNIETIVFYDKDIDDLALALVGERYRVDLTKYVIPRSDDPTPGRWVKSVFPSSEQTFDGAITHSHSGIIHRHAYGVPSELNTPIPIDIKEGEVYEIWVRPLKGPDRGRLSMIASKDLYKGNFTYYDDFETNKWKKDIHSYKKLRESKIHSYGVTLFAPVEGGISELVYKIDPPEPIRSMWMEWDTLFLNESRIGKFFVSEDCKNWIQMGENQIVDVHPYRFDITNFAKGKKRFYIKYQIEAFPKLGGAVILYTKYHYGTVSTKQTPETEQDLKDKADSLQWIKAGTFYLDKGRHFFQIIHHPGPIGMVDQFIVIPKEIIDSLRQDISNILQAKDVVLIKEPDNLSTDINIPKEGRYRIVANISNHNFSGNLSINLNGNKIKEKKLSNKDESLWIETEAVSLKDGVANIVVSKQGNGEIELKQVVLYKTNLPVSCIGELFKTEERIPVMWKMINPTKYEVKLKIEKPAYLVFSEGFDPHWILNLKEPLHSISAYSLINSFFIDQPGEIDATLEFTPQKYVYKGLWVSGIGLALICFYFFCQGVGLLGKKRKD